MNSLLSILTNVASIIFARDVGLSMSLLLTLPKALACGRTKAGIDIGVEFDFPTPSPKGEEFPVVEK